MIERLINNKNSKIISTILYTIILFGMIVGVIIKELQFETLILTTLLIICSKILETLYDINEKIK